MKQMMGWQTSVAVTVPIAIAVMAFPAFSTATAATTPQNLQPSPNKGEYQLAQTADNCRRVNTNGSNLNVRFNPWGRILGSLQDGTLVTITNQGSNNWVPISSPIAGYVYGTYLTLCNQPIPPGETPTPLDNCREVKTRVGIAIREESSITSPIIGRLTYNQRVTIVNRGANGWVPISSPVSGYISAIDLRYCR